MRRKLLTNDYKENRKVMYAPEKKGTQGRRTPKSQLNFIAVMRRQGHSIPRILEQLREVFGDEARGERTVQNHVKRIDENRIPWDRFATDGDDAKLIFEVLAEVGKASDGTKQSFTQEEADSVLWVRKTAPTLPPYYVWVTAVLYMAEVRVRPEEAQDFAPLDAFLAYKPWQSLEAMIEFDDRYQQGKIGGSSPVGIWGVQQGHSIINVACLARQQVYQLETKADEAELAKLAKGGNSDAIMALSLLNDWKAIPIANMDTSVANMDTSALPIDEQHASLGMVYTNPQDQEEVKEDEE